MRQRFFWKFIRGFHDRVFSAKLGSENMKIFDFKEFSYSWKLSILNIVRFRHSSINITCKQNFLELADNLIEKTPIHQIESINVTHDLEVFSFLSDKQDDTTHLEDGNASLFIRCEKVQTR